jgi:hypothetical protein
MAQPLTEAEKADIRLFLGYQARFHQLDSALEFAMHAVDEVSNLAAYNQITRALAHADGPGILALIKDVDTKIRAQDPQSTVEKVGSIELDAARGMGVLRSKGRAYVGRLATILGVPVRRDYFSGSGGGPYLGVAGMGGGGGNLPPLG